jgi:hypothetical protein
MSPILRLGVSVVLVALALPALCVTVVGRRFHHRRAARRRQSRGPGRLTEVPMARRAAALLALTLAGGLGGSLVRPLAAEAPTGAPPLPKYALDVTLDPLARTLRVDATLALPPSASADREFALNARLSIASAEPAVTEIPARRAAPRAGINGAATEDDAAPVKRYKVTLPREGGTLRLVYSGPFDFGLSAEAEQYTRGFRSTAGIVSPEGVYLAGDGAWYPKLGDGLVEFEVIVHQPDGWMVVSEGNGTARDEKGLARWNSHGPTDEIHLVGGPVHLTRQAAGAVETEVYLRQPDAALASKYLTATAQYLEMYRGLIGPYPYGKFALVENFWETGYGMPSFTLLGSQIIRFPFILTSSYPHEILHNWWGNSVFVDYDTGNWCEGLTAYMADHLIQEQRGAGEAYRRATLQKYRDYVRDGRDFPLTEFRARHSAATEAVGYGRTMMGFHMLRRRVGDEAFKEWASRFYREHRGKRASFADVRSSLEAVSKQDLGRFFADWISRPGAATLAVAVESVVAADRGFVTSGVVRQTQPGAPFELSVPVVVQTVGPAVVQAVALDGTEARFTILTPDAPVSVAVDPSFDLFRRLDPRETPPSIGQIFGEPRVLAILPASATPEEAAGYRSLVESWRAPAHEPEILTDAEVKALPSDRPVWILGRRNRFASSIVDGGAVKSGETRVEIDGTAVEAAAHSIVVVRRHPGNPEKAIGWIAVDPIAALPGLGRKLPHYGKYSYLAFEGAEPVNTVKGEWSQSDSPLRVDLRPAATRASALPALALPARTALAALPAVFSETSLRSHVAALTAPGFEGRGVGTAGLDRAAEWVAAQFKAAGLAPGGDAGTYLQRFETARTPDGTPRPIANIVGIIPGSDPNMQGQSVVATAHYDHLGLGWPDPRKGDEGRLHPGADDNASGVAVLLELARVLAADARPKRTIVFVAFTGEETGLAGSRYYAAHPLFPLDKAIGVINIDSVGRLFAGVVNVLCTGTATEWQHIFRGASFVTGVESKNVPELLASSDQAAFYEKGVPAVQIVTPTHADYHRPGDTADKVDYAGLVKVAALVKEGIAYLAERETPLTVTITAPRGGTAQGAPAAGPPPGTARRASLGTIPDFAYPGPGVKVSGVTPGSPAEAAGLRAGDIVVALAGTPVESLKAYSDVLKMLVPGQLTEVVIDRGGVKQTIALRLGER